MGDRELDLARSAIERFLHNTAAHTSFNEELASEYQRMKVALATCFQTMATNVVPRKEFPLSVVKEAVVGRMKERFGGHVDSSLLKVGGYGSTHSDLYATLAANVGERLPSWRLRLLTRDAIHTERRTRELRDLGLAISIHVSDVESFYCLESLAPDFDYGAAYQLRENATKSKRITNQTRAHAIQLAERAAALPSRNSQ